MTAAFGLHAIHARAVHADASVARRIATLLADTLRAPEWGTYLSPAHVDLVGRDKLVAAAAVAIDVGSLLYLQCSLRAADALGPEAARASS